MSRQKKIREIIDKVSDTNVEFSKEINTEFDFDANLDLKAKEEINRVKEFYDGKI